MFFHATLVLLAAVAGVSAVPGASHAKRDVWIPPILEPTGSTVWYTGSTVTVSWNTSTPPQQVTNPKGTLYLGFLEAAGKGGENLDTKNPLATGFDLHAGKTDVLVPEVASKANYIVALLGDSGNISPLFTIASKK
ncbi:hypothetical protein BC834DRAFT_819670 [Gloeopeniophorella convolvens]|nr:hypothetical protein BC834DRAFT_819670 [Gloeopeniophorella convolvens]